ncbi:MAG: hypothetical protein ACYTFW_24885 [Planctomycetota bacterium]
MPLSKIADKHPFSVVFEPSHLFGPIFGLYTTGLGHVIDRVELAMPFQDPQLP